MDEDTARLQQQIVELRRDMDLALERQASLIEYYATKAVDAQTRDRLPTPEELAWLKRALAASIERSKSIRLILLDVTKLGVWAGLAFVMFSVWEAVKAKVGTK
jgi:hypothetical protein